MTSFERRVRPFVIVLFFLLGEGEGAFFLLLQLLIFVEIMPLHPPFPPVRVCVCVCWGGGGGVSACVCLCCTSSELCLEAKEQRLQCSRELTVLSWC